ncbi:MAG: dockerin type I domain-containing protein [Pirellulaceae bacterium]
MSFTNGSEPTVSRTGSSRKRRPASRLTTRGSKWKTRRLFLEPLEARVVLAADFFAGPLTVPATNHADVGLGRISNFGFPEPNLTISNRGNTGNIVVQAHERSAVSSDAFVNINTGVYGVPTNGDTWADSDSTGRVWWTNLDAATGGVRVVEMDPVTGAPIGLGVVVNDPPGTQSDDRQALAADSFPESPWHDNIYVVWTRFGLGGGDSTRVFVARSADHGVTWLSQDIGAAGFDQQVHIAVGSNGDVYAAYHLQPGFVAGQTSLPDGTSGQVIVFRSTDGGTTWSQTGTNPFTAGQADISFNRQENAVGNFAGTDFLTQGSVHPYVLPDPIRNGQVYVIAADDTDNNHGAGDDSDLYISRSDNNGATWTRTLLPTGGGTSFQLFPTGVIDQFGNLVVTWYDNRRGLVNDGADNIAGNGDDNFLLDWMGMYSVDGGVNWSAPFRINDAAFDPDEAPTTSFQGGPTTRIGEYFGLDLFGGTAYVAFNGNTPATPGVAQQVFFDAFAINGTLQITGDDNGPTNDEFLIRRLAADTDYVEIFVNGVQQYFGLFEALTRVDFAGMAGNDRLVVDSSNGLLNFAAGINFNGGTGFDRLDLTQTGGPTRNSSRVNVGANPGDGQSIIDTQVVNFQNIAPLTDNVPATTFTLSSAPGIASLLDADNAINYTAAQILTTAGRITVDNFEPVEFDNKTNVVINAGAGSDTINLNNQTTPSGLTGTITVAGGDPTGSDTLILNGISGLLDNLRYLPTNVGAGTVVNDGASQPNVLFTGTEHLTLVIQQADGDGVRVDGTTGNDAVEYSHGATSGSGSFAGTMDQTGVGVGPFTMTPMSYSGASPAANDSDVNFFNPGGTDSFVFNGTSADDTIDIRTGEAGGTEFQNTLNGIVVSRLEVFNVASTLARGLAGNDAFNVTPPAGPAAVTLRVEGGDSDSSSDTINYRPVANANTTINLVASTITSSTANPLSFSGIEHIVETSSGASSSLTINATTGNDTFYISSVAGTGSLYAEFGPNVDFSGVLSSITFNGNDPTASDTLILNGVAGTTDHFILIDSAKGAGSISNFAVAPNLDFTGIEHLTIVGQPADNDGLAITGTLGNDTFIVSPGADPTAGQVTGFAPGFAFVPIEYFGLSGYLAPSTALLDKNTFNTLITGTVGGSDTIILNGTSADDTFDWDATLTFAAQVRVNTGANIHTPVILSGNGQFGALAQATLRGLSGNDTFNLANPPTGGLNAYILRVEGGDSDANTDTLNHTGAGGTTSVDLATSTITATAGIPVTYSGLERVNLSNATGALAISGTTGEDSINFIPTGIGAGSFTAASTGATVATYPQFTYAMSGASTITVDSLASFDTVGLTATSGNDVVNAVQSGASALSYTQNAFTQLFSVTNLEKVKLSTLGGDDLIRVSVADALAGSLGFDIDGGSPNASDRLIVDDAGLGDLTILRQAPDQRSGSVTVGALNPVFYTDIERLDITPVNSVTGGVGTDGAGRIKVFHSDPFEYNETRLTAATLSRVGESANRPTIDPGAVIAPFAVPGDEDWYDFRPQATGTFSVKILFDTQGPLANGRAGLPGTGDLNLDIYDANGVLIVSGVVAPGGKAAVFGATNDPAFPQFNRIFVRVRGASADSINHYEFDNLDAVGTGNPGVGNVDVFGPQVTNVQVNNVPSATYNLFNSKTTNNSLIPTPLANSLTISFRDLPARAPGFLYASLDPNSAISPGTYVVRGDATGIAAISSIILVNNPVVVGGVPTATVQIVFAKPLPDDRFTLTINDNLQDPAGNALDGESNAAEPNGAPTFPSGDTHAGGDFIARFTIDTRAELGAWASGSVYVDTNGNYSFDPTNLDASNRDITYLMGFTSDNIFAGNFVAAVAGVADGFDKLAAYGKVGTSYRWLIDTNNDGVPEINVVQPLFAGVTNIGGTPVAGNFDNNAANGDEVALKVGNTWLLDTNHDFKVDLKLPGTNMSGLPITGDFDGDGKEDLGAWADDKFSIDFGSNGLSGTTEFSFTFGFASVRERPVASDFDGDGITDLGLWVPDRAGVAPFESAEWYLFISNNQSILTRNAANGGMFFKPAPFGSDRFAQYGDEWGLPIAGNFDPPVTSAQPAGSFTNSRDREDVDNDGFVSPIDALMIINRINSGDTSLDSTPFARAPYVDVNGDGTLAPVDALLVINRLNAPAGGDSSGEGEGEAADAFFGSLGSRPASDSSLSALLAVDDYFNNRKK